MGRGGVREIMGIVWSVGGDRVGRGGVREIMGDCMVCGRG